MMYRAAIILALLTPALAHAQAQPTNEPPKPPPPSWRQIVGFEEAYTRLKPDMPTGRGITVGYVEGNAGNYPPKRDDKRLAHVDILLRSGEATPTSHATHGAVIAFGADGIAPGVKDVHAFSVHNWMTNGYLHVGRGEPPADDGVRLFNHSWIGGTSGSVGEVLRRVDWVIDERDVMMCVGVNNGRDTAVPGLLASAYNVVAVGTAKGGGDSSGGYTQTEVSGRCKPDIVGPRDLTSFATPSVTATCAILMERAGRMSDARAQQSELIKATLLAGAVKPRQWSSAEGKPLDEHLGAGIVNVNRSLMVLDHGPVDGRQLARPWGWSVLAMKPGQTRSFHFETSQVWRQVTIVAVWHRRIDGRVLRPLGGEGPVWLDTPRLAQVDLALTRFDERGAATELAASRSAVDNVEHIYRGVLMPGRYRIDVVRDDKLDESWDVALAWWMQLAEDQQWDGTAPPEGLETAPADDPTPSE